MVFYVFLCRAVCWFVYGPFCYGALKLDIFTLFSTFFLWTSLQFKLHSSTYVEDWTRWQWIPNLRRTLDNIDLTHANIDYSHFFVSNIKWPFCKDIWNDRPVKIRWWLIQYCLYSVPPLRHPVAWYEWELYSFYGYLYSLTRVGKSTVPQNFNLLPFFYISFIRVIRVIPNRKFSCFCINYM